MIHEYFPPVALELQRELENHPTLTAIITPGMTLEEKIGHIAAYCNVILDGDYLEEDLEKLFHYLLHKLRKKSAIIVM